jgi:hypothetical protein
MGLGNFGALGAVVRKHVDQDYKLGFVIAIMVLKKDHHFRDVKNGTPL